MPHHTKDDDTCEVCPKGTYSTSFSDEWPLGCTFCASTSYQDEAGRVSFPLPLRLAKGTNRRPPLPPLPSSLPPWHPLPYLYPALPDYPTSWSTSFFPPSLLCLGPLHHLHLLSIRIISILLLCPTLSTYSSPT